MEKNYISFSIFLFIMFFCSVASNLFSQRSPYPIIFLHGWGGSDEGWQTTINALKQIYYVNETYDKNVFHAILNANLGSTNLAGNNNILGDGDDDVLFYFLNCDNNLNQSDVYAINFQNWFWNDDKNYISKRNNSKPSMNESRSNESSIYKQGYALSKAIEKVLAATNAEKVILVGHSLGGLTIREYLQRKENGIRKWWIDPYSEDGHKVVKVVTIGTPHLGSNLSQDFDGTLLDEFVSNKDIESEAVRDLRYSYSEYIFFKMPGVYLFGGKEYNIPLYNHYHNYDVNCDGDESDSIIGISEGTSFNPAQSLPNNIKYTWITSKLTLFGDGVVSLDRQWLHSHGQATPENCTDTLRTNIYHTDESKDYYSIIRGLDEPDIPELAYKIDLNKPYNGTATIQSNYNRDNDDDWYRFDLTTTKKIKVFLNPVKDLAGQIDFYRNIPYNNNNAPDGWRTTFGINSGNKIFETPEELAPGTYYIRIRHININDNSWMFPYTIRIGDEASLKADFTTSLTYSKLYNGESLGITFNSEKSKAFNTVITYYEWDFGDGTISYEKNPTHKYKSVGFFDVKLKISDGVLSDTKTISKMIVIDPMYAPNKRIVKLEFAIDNPSNRQLIQNFNSHDIDIEYDILAYNFATLPAGLHKLFIIATDSEGKESIPQGLTFLLLDKDPSLRKPKILKMEYFWDNDPGFGKGFNMNISPIEVIEMNNKTIDCSGLSDGLHRIYVRCLDELGKWGIVQSRTVLINQKDPNNFINEIVKVEYFWDNDPGFDYGIEIPINKATEIDLQEIINCSNLSLGLHRFYLRAKDILGKWSIVQSRTVLILQTKELPKIVKGEYYLDNDPGIGKAKKLIFAEDTNVTIDRNILFCPIDSGSHNVFFRFQDEFGKWSIPRSISFDVNTNKYSSQDVENEPKIIVKYPNGEEKLSEGRRYTIKWNSKCVEYVKIQYSINGGSSWIDIIDALMIPAEDGQFEWETPKTVSDFCLVRIIDAFDNSIFDISDKMFSIIDKNSIIITLSDKNTCKNQSIQLGTKNDEGNNITVQGGSGNYYIMWFPSNGLLNANSSNPTVVKPQASSNYTLYVSDYETGVSSTKTMTLYVRDEPFFTLPTLVTIKKGSSVKLDEKFNAYKGTPPFRFSWTDKENWSSEEQSPTVSPTKTTRYFLKITDVFDCVSEEKSMLVKVLNNREGLNYSEFIELIDVYPNPTNDIFNLEINFEKNVTSEIRLLSLLGEIIQEVKYYDVDYIKHQFDLSGFASGVYIIRINVNGENFFEKIIKE